MQTTQTTRKQRVGSQPARIHPAQRFANKPAHGNFRTRGSNASRRLPYTVPAVGKSIIDVRWNALGIHPYAKFHDQRIIQLVWNILKKHYGVKMIKLTPDLNPWEMIHWLYTTLQGELKLKFDTDETKLYAGPEQLLVITGDYSNYMIEPHFLYYDFLKTLRKRSYTAFRMVLDMLHLLEKIVGVALWGEGYSDYLVEIMEEEASTMISDDPENADEHAEKLDKLKKVMTSYNAYGTPYNYKQMVRHRKTSIEKFARDVSRYRPRNKVYAQLKKVLEAAVLLFNQEESYDRFIFGEEEDSEVVFYYEFMYVLWDEDAYAQMVLDDLNMKCDCSFYIKPLQKMDIFDKDGGKKTTDNSEFPRLFYEWWRKSLDFQGLIYSHY